MLQILGWLGCLMLAVKLVEMGHNPTLYNDEGRLKETAGWIIVAGWAGVLGFAVWFWIQGQEVSEIQSSLEPTYSSELERAQKFTECFEAAGDDYEAAAKC